ncbi:MAG: acetylxylan esterase [Armatimonadota bacterium]|nr:acetylxylan esterase [Armatimonadota bacterium]
MIWNTAVLQKSPRTFDAPGFAETGVQALFYEALPWRGQPTRSFAWLGLPERREAERVPAMVLVHGGGGTAYADWVRLWTSRGYAAIAMDTCGCTAGGERGQRPRHEWGGPPGFGGWEQIEWPVEDQWLYHAVADVMLAHSLLRSFDEVDSTRIGLTGISWGGFITCMVAGLDPRFALAAPVYGCGCVAENGFLSTLLPEDSDAAQRWLDLWDPAHFLPQAALPMLWVNGTNDFAFPMNVYQQSYRLAPGPRTLSIRVRMEHSQPAGSTAPEISAFADSLFKGEPSLASIIEQQRDGSSASVRFAAEVPVVRAELNTTMGTGRWTEREWQTLPAEVFGDTVSGQLPPGATAYFFNLIDERGLVVSSEMNISES